jgi:hypothetical protein
MNDPLPLQINLQWTLDRQRASVHSTISVFKGDEPALVTMRQHRHKKLRGIARSPAVVP